MPGPHDADQSDHWLYSHVTYLQVNTEKRLQVSYYTAVSQHNTSLFDGSEHIVKGMTYSKRR